MTTTTTQPAPAILRAGDYLFESDPMKIGKRTWRAVVYQTDYWGPCADYEWADESRYGIGEIWRPAEEWPRSSILRKRQ